MIPTPRIRRRSGLFAAAALACVLAVTPATSLASGGGVGPGSTGGGGGGTGPAGDARLKNGLAVPPSNAPSRVKKVIEAANDIAKGKPYCMGGGHGSWHDNCYDCSGSVSYALHGGDFVSSPMPSGSYMHWQKKGKGKWITVFANSGHMYAVIAGLRFDTSMTEGDGPGWSKQMRSSSGFKVRHPKNF